MTYSILSTMTLAGAYNTALVTARAEDRTKRHNAADAPRRAVHTPRGIIRWLSVLPVFAKTARS